MTLLEYILILAIAAQIVFTVQITTNYRYFCNKYRRVRKGYRPQCIVIIPCKGIDETFDENIKSFFHQDYSNYHLRFVVEDIADPAYSRLSKIINEHKGSSRALSVELLVAGLSGGCSQKLHNLLYAYRQIPRDTEALVFADSDVNSGSNWLSHLVYPLRQKKVGISSGYRWFIPEKNNLASIALSAINAKICQMLGNTIFNLAWGGSMAISVENFRKLQIEQLWQKALSDDLSISYAIRKAKLKIAFVPACLTATYESTTWPKLWEFGRRQFIITRIYSPGMWIFGLFSSIFAVLGLWGGIGLAIWAKLTNADYIILCMAVPVVFAICQFVRAVIRQKIAFKLLPQQKMKLRPVRVADMLFFWFWTIILMIMILSTVFGRKIVWRGIRYKINSPTDIEVVNRK